MANQRLEDDNGIVAIIDANGFNNFEDVLGNYTLTAADSFITVADRVLDFGLAVLADEADQIYICSAEPLTYAQATSLSPSYALAFKNFGSPGGAFSAVASPGSPDLTGRSVATTAITDGIVLQAGSGAWWAAVDSANSRLLVRGSLVSAQTVFASGSFSLPSFTLRMPGQ